MAHSREPFWLEKSLEEMTPDEWELLCDGCGRCCLFKVQYEDTGEVYYTNVACGLLDAERCRCTSYERRSRLVPSCLVLTPAKARELQWLPPTCAYRRLALGKDLEWWHPLISGEGKTVRQAGISVCGRVIPERYVPPNQLEQHIIHWWPVSQRTAGSQRSEDGG
jgi:uncharacterized cysteine cluster protein YcgN (CxxCxxCC family)